MRCRALLRFVPRACGILALAWAALAQTPILVPSTTQLTLNAVANGPAPLSQIFTIAESDGSFVNINTLVDAGSPGTAAPPWITVTPHLATTPAQVQVSANTTGLAPGPYSARIQFTNLQGKSLGSPVIVTLQVATAPAQLAISPPVVNLVGPIEQGYLQEGIFLRSVGPGTLAPVSVSVVSGYPWLSAVVPSCDTTCAITVKAAIATAPPGLESGLLHVSTALGSADVPITVFAAAHGSFVQLAPKGLQFYTVEDTGLVDSRTLSLLNTGDAAANWAADVLAGQAWLSLNMASGSTAAGSSAQLTATMNSGFMPQGTYGGLIRISSQDGSFNPLYVPVVLRIDPEDTPPIPLLSTGGIFFQEQVGGSGQHVPLTLSAGSPSAIDYQASEQSAGWLSAGPTRGQVSGPSPVPLSIIETPLGLQAGFYSGLVNVAFGAGALHSLNVGISVVDPAATACQPQFLYLTETALGESFATRVGYATPLEAVLVDDCGSLISNGLVNEAFSNGDPDVTLEPLGQGLYAGTWIPGHASDSLANGVATVALRGFVPALATALAELSGTVANETVPILNTNSVLNNLNPQVGAPLAPGTIVQIYGASLGTVTGGGAVVNGQLQTSLNGVSVSVNGIAAPLFYASSGQINAQLPSELEGGQQYQVLVNVNGLYSNPLTINTTAVQPGLASFPDGTVIAQDLGYNLITADHPAQAGEVIILYATGLGPSNPPVATGAVAPSPPMPLAQVTVAPVVTVGGANAQVVYAGLSPGSVGLYQIDVVVPASAGTGNLPLGVMQGGVASNTVTVPVQ